MLNQITIQNFKSIEKTELDMEGPVVALVGRNGVGKTNILLAIKWLADCITRQGPIELDVLSSLGRKTTISCTIVLGDCSYLYKLTFDAPPLTPLTELHRTKPPKLVESLQVTDPHDETSTVFERDGETISVPNRTEGIRIGRTTGANGAILALLPTDNRSHEHVQSFVRFWTKVSYYPATQTDATPYMVSSDEYEAWKLAHKAAGVTTDSTLMRLLYLMQEEPDTFSVIKDLLGPNGLNLLRNINVLPLDEPHPPNSKPKPGKKMYFSCLSREIARQAMETPLV